MCRLRMIAVVLPFAAAILIYTSTASSQSRSASSHADIALEITGTSEQPSYHLLPDPSSSTSLLYQFRRIAGWQRPPTQTVDVSAIKMLSRREGGEITIEVSVLLGPFDRTVTDTTRSLRGVPEERIGTYLAHMGDTISLRELTRFGIEPINIAVVSSRPPTTNPPRIVNRTQSVEVVSIEELRQQYRISLRNVSTKNIIALNLYADDRGGSAGQTQGGLIASGGMSEIVFSVGTSGYQTPQGFVPNPPEQPTIVIGTVVFADGTFEGEVEAAAEIEAGRRGLQIQSRRMLALLQNALTTPNQDITVIIERLRTQISALSEEADGAALEEITSRYPSLSTESNLVTLSLNSGLRHAKQLMLLEISEFERTREQTRGPQRLRAWLLSAKERFERIVNYEP